MTKTQTKKTKNSPEILLKFIHLCDYFLVSQDGKMSIIGDFDRLWTTDDRALLNKAYLVFKLQAQANKTVEFSVKLIDPNGHILNVANFGVPSNEYGVVPFTFEITNLVFNVFGKYKFQIIAQEQILGEAELSVEKVNQPKTAKA